MRRLGVMVGLPRSGKSTWAAQLRKTQGYTVLCPDDLREVLTGQVFYRNAEDFVWATTFLAARALLKSHNDVLIDATSITADYRQKWIQVANEMNAIPLAYAIYTFTEECIERAGSDDELIQVIHRMAHQFEKVFPHEGFWATTTRPA